MSGDELTHPQFIDRRWTPACISDWNTWPPNCEHVKFERHIGKAEPVEVDDVR